MDHLSPISTSKKEQMCDKCPETTEQRCSVQWRCGASSTPDVQYPPHRRRGGRPAGQRGRGATAHTGSWTEERSVCYLKTKIDFEYTKSKLKELNEKCAELTVSEKHNQETIAFLKSQADELKNKIG